MLAEVLETYTPEERYSMSTFLDGVESYFGSGTRDSISRDSFVYITELVLNEQHLYGSSRLGMIQHADTFRNIYISHIVNIDSPDDEQRLFVYGVDTYYWDSLYNHQRGSKVYEGTNHLGNVLVTFFDKRLIECQEDTIYRYVADVKSQTDYSAFGVLLEERQWYANQDSGGYRFGFNGKENFNKVVGNGNWQDYGERMYSPRLGRFPSPDPIIIHGRQYPMLSSFQFASNSPIQAIDLDGLEGVQYNELYTNWRGKTKIKTVVEIDVHVGINNLNGYTSDDLEFIHKGLIMEYNNGRKHGRKVDGRRVEFRFNMNTFDLNSITAEDKSKELRRIRKVGVSVDSYGNPLKHTNGEEVLKASIVGVVLYINNELPDNLGGKTDRNISGINPNSHNIRHSEAHEIGHFLLWDSPENPISDEAHDKDDGVFYNYTVNGNTNEYITRPKGVSKNNIRSILRNAPRIEHQEE